MHLSIFALSAPKVEDSSRTPERIKLCHMHHMTEEYPSRCSGSGSRQKRPAELNYLERLSEICFLPPAPQLCVMILALAHSRMSHCSLCVEVNDVRCESCLTRSLHRPLQDETVAPSAEVMQALEAAWPSPLSLLPIRDSPQQLLLRRTSVADEEDVQHVHKNEKHSFCCGFSAYLLS